MREQGLEHVYQLEGGILKYFEHTDGAHYHGGCFVLMSAPCWRPDPLHSHSPRLATKMPVHPS